VLVNAFDRLAGLPISVESYSLEDRDRALSPTFTRPSTLVRIQGGGEEGLGEDVVYDDLDHFALRDAGPVHDLTDPKNLGELCELVGSLDLFQDAPPVRELSRLYRRWAFESAALDLALGQAGQTLGQALEIEPRPLTFVCSTRLSSFGEDGGSTTEPVRRRLAKYPSLRFKLDPENDWTDELIAELVEIAEIDILDLKGLYSGTPVDVDTDPVLYRKVAEAFPSALLEDPDLTEETEAVLEPHKTRISFDAPIHSVADIEALPLRPTMVNVKPSRIGSLRELLETYEWCEREGIGMYGGGQAEQSVGRGQIQYLGSLFHADTPNDTAPGGYNDSEVPDGLPTSPMDPVPSATGFRWAE
jgi:L-alanine-DL-glutamate epimerase-like enolase superfamily enzyme